MSISRSFPRSSGVASRLQGARWARWLVLSAVLMGAAGCGPAAGPALFQGYIEAEYVYVASPQPGQLRSLAVERGQEVQPGTRLFELDPEPEVTRHREALQRTREAQARLDDLRKGKRPSEMEALQAKLEQAKVSLQLAELEFKRVNKLHQDDVVSIDDLDRVRATRDLYQAQVAEFTADLETARLGGRADAIEAAESAVAAAQAAAAAAAWNLAQKSQTSPVQATVHDTLYRPGEWVAGGRPVVVLFPPGYLKVRFFVPENELARAQPGAAVRVTFDGAPQPYQGRISYVSTRAEFTPPVIYSQETRSKLVFMVEATFENQPLDSLRPGQPVDVTWTP